MSTLNHSLWQDQAGAPGIICESPIPSNIADNEILVKVHAWAMNPAGAMVQDVPLPFIKYPLILGKDVAGTVERAGSAATARFQPGDRVLGLALGAATAKPEQDAFQDYVILDHSMACKIPDSLSFIEASVFPLCIATAAHGIFSKDYLGLPFPTTNTPTNSTGKSIFIWGGSAGVGSNAIQHEAEPARRRHQSGSRGR
jgi:NADPH:quinone reductase-like Zn-dependent oxidoreductase